MHAVAVYGHAIGTISCLKAGRHDRRSDGNANPTYISTRLAYFIDKDSFAYCLCLTALLIRARYL